MGIETATTKVVVLPNYNASNWRDSLPEEKGLYPEEGDEAGEFDDSERIELLVETSTEERLPNPKELGTILELVDDIDQQFRDQGRGHVESFKFCGGGVQVHVSLSPQKIQVIPSDDALLAAELVKKHLRPHISGGFIKTTFHTYSMSSRPGSETIEVYVVDANS
jgi:hypothetical protein